MLCLSAWAWAMAGLSSTVRVECARVAGCVRLLRSILSQFLHCAWLRAPLLRRAVCTALLGRELVRGPRSMRGPRPWSRQSPPFSECGVVRVPTLKNIWASQLSCAFRHARFVTSGFYPIPRNGSFCSGVMDSFLKDTFGVDPVAVRRKLLHLLGDERCAAKAASVAQLCGIGNVYEHFGVSAEALVCLARQGARSC